MTTTVIQNRERAVESDHVFTVTLDLGTGYAQTVDFGVPDVPPLTVDEPPPLGTGAGPNPARLLAGAVGSCLAASLTFCMRKARCRAVLHGDRAVGDDACRALITAGRLAVTRRRLESERIMHSPTARS